MSCDEGSPEPPVFKVFNRWLLLEAVSRGDPRALDGLLQYLQSSGKRLTDEEFKGAFWEWISLWPLSHRSLITENCHRIVLDK